MNGDEKADVLRAEDCTGCRLCELRCPDFAIEVAQTGERKVVVSAVAESDAEGERGAKGDEDD